MKALLILARNLAVLLTILAVSQRSWSSPDPCPTPGARSPRRQSLAYEVNKAIDRGVANLRRRQNPDGSFREGPSDRFPIGVTALALYTLVKSEVPADDPAVVKALGCLRYKPFGMTYGTAVLILALDALHDPAHDSWIRNAAGWLEGNVHSAAHLWAYPEGAPDLSNTQYAVLGLWTAERHGYKSARETWGRLLEAVLRHQNKDGGFGYHPGDPSTGSMTTAGITVVLLARERIKGDTRFAEPWHRSREALTHAWSYLGRRFDVRGNPVGQTALQDVWFYYYLYGIERVGAIAGVREIGDHDWYREGAEELVDRQLAGGEWGDTPRTCFALLFLRRATLSGLHPDKVAELDAALERSRREKQYPRPRPESPFIRRWLVLGPIDDPDDVLLEKDPISEAKVAPRAGRRTHKLTWTPLESLASLADPETALGPADHCLFYLFTYLHAAKPIEGRLWFGADDGCRVILDGEQVFDLHMHGGPGADSHSVPLSLSPGVHRLLIKLSEWAGTSGIRCRFSDTRGAPLEGLTPSLSAKDSESEQTARAQPGFYTEAQLLEHLPLDRKKRLTFEHEDATMRVSLAGCFDRYPLRQEAPAKTPNRARPRDPAAWLVLHPVNLQTPARLIRKVKVPYGRPVFFVRACPHDPLGKPVGDFVCRLVVFDGSRHLLREQTVGGLDPKTGGRWHEIEADISEFAGRTVLLIVECAAGGSNPWSNEQAAIAEVSVR